MTEFRRIPGKVTRTVIAGITHGDRSEDGGLTDTARDQLGLGIMNMVDAFMRKSIPADRDVTFRVEIETEYERVEES